MSRIYCEACDVTYVVGREYASSRTAVWMHWHRVVYDCAGAQLVVRDGDGDPTERGAIEHVAARDIERARMYDAGYHAGHASALSWAVGALSQMASRIALARVRVDVGERASPSLDERPACSGRSMTLRAGDGACEPRWLPQVSAADVAGRVVVEDGAVASCRYCGRDMTSEVER